jgi:ABC-type nitrate/sulfonate/bicarbonate transport system ATPase subunit
MTTEQQDKLRLQAWDDYQSAKKELAAQNSRLANWRVALANVAMQLEHGGLDLIDQEFVKIPNHETFTKGIEEFKAARLNLQRARETAQRFSWPVDLQP